MIKSNHILPSITIVTSNEKKLKSIQAFFKEKKIDLTTIIISENTPIELITQKQQDVFLVELHLAQFDGIEVCEIIKTKFENASVLLVSEETQEYIQVEAYKAGADDFITPTIQPQLLLKKIAALLKRKTIAKNKSISNIYHNSIKVNRESYLIEKDNQEIALQKKQFELLYLLISNPKRIFTRDELYNSVWENTDNNNPRIIDVHIRKIREKIGENIIKTIKGRGYRFAE
ncbi:TPA: response regulator transcription factor [Klebsiella aerogenes]|nr:response regulator transcription factor [Klebsiella aerogenes]HEJ0126872.1 response regulator transcription factor [Klebsiella aerogenes]